ncbi:helix-turn-helix domain-containing protein [Pedomonas mirosovicensis]|uniref:helix-turn-helix domain-containing protein n=1 Tax=Pedomonas mirosovicensis TaxID=2908641 RepID=UPI00216A3E0D|nr:helix-turn-helix transcriptional regulator [Pedomonas mirosovicensis]MCH8685712.1 helix-turn-helix domain-containing protein [Pedomonas mirosovicensis]
MKTKRARETELKLDREVAARVRAQRLASGLTQTELGKRIGVTFQQIQKYENGSNRLTAGKLIILSEILGVPVEQFLVESAPAHRPQPSPALSALAPEPSGGSRSVHREVLELVRGFARIEDARTRKHILTLIKHLGATAAERAEESETAAA